MKVTTQKPKKTSPTESSIPRNSSGMLPITNPSTTPHNKYNIYQQHLQSSNHSLDPYSNSISTSKIVPLEIQFDGQAGAGSGTGRALGGQGDGVERLMELEGECKVREWEFIRFNRVRAVFAIIAIVISVFGLFALKYSYWFRRVVFFDAVTQFQQATHIYITGNDKKTDIVKILKPKSNPIYFQYKKLKYSINPTKKLKPRPVGYQFQKQFLSCFSQQRFQKGLSTQEAQKHRQLYGPNQHMVEMPSYPEYLIDVLTQPFFLLQYFFCFVFFLEGYAPFSFALLFFSFVTTTVNYGMLYYSYKKIKQIAQKICQINIIRNGNKIKVDSRQLVPGDVYIPENDQQIPADCIVGMGDVYVNQANLTGQSFPIGKFKISSPKDIDNSSVWLYQGSKILQNKEGHTFAIVINTGFTTTRGRIVRKILNRTIKDPDILRTTLIFVFQAVIVSIITFFATLYLLLQRDIQKIFVFFKAIDFLASSAPPTLPIFFNLAYSLSLFRLSFKGVTGTEPQKTVDGAQVKTFCFDKTGTLTKNTVNIMKVFKIKGQKNLSFHNVIEQIGNYENSLIWQLFATCHTTKLIKEELLGDQIDKEMFKFINAQMQHSADQNIRLVVKSTKQFPRDSVQQIKGLSIGREQDRCSRQRRRSSLLKMKAQHHLQILRINQFQSKFQSMSVLVHDVIDNKYLIFAKGSPQKILQNSSNISPTKGQNSPNHESYMNMIKSLSLNGLRTIGMAYKEISKEEVDVYMNLDREQYLKNLSNLGLIAFENGLKEDTWLTINKLKDSNIENKIITGDNIYIAAETARRAGIIDEDQTVVFLQGHKNINEGKPTTKNGFYNTYKGTIVNRVKNDTFSNQPSKIEQQTIEINQTTDYLHGKHVYAVDNSFITMEPAPTLSHRIKVFARIPPENKAYIIKKYKEQHNQYLRSNFSKFTIWMKTHKWKVGFCGDGANDLLALREADLSVGIQATDASYGSSFTVKNILDVDWIIKQSKCTQSNIVQLYQFYGSICLVILFASIIMITDVTYFSTTELMYLNFGTVLLIPGTIAMSRPSQQQTRYVPDLNMMGLHNQLVFWGNTLIPFFGILGAWFYYSNTDQYQSNPKPSASVAGGGFNSRNYSTTFIFILVLMVTASNAVIMYRSRPWRERFFRNYLFTLLISLNLAIAFIFAFLTHAELLQKSFQFQPISHTRMGISLGILFGSLFISLIFNTVINALKLDHKQIHIDQQPAPTNISSRIINKASTLQLHNNILQQNYMLNDIKKQSKNSLTVEIYDERNFNNNNSTEINQSRLNRL